MNAHKIWLWIVIVAVAVVCVLFMLVPVQASGVFVEVEKIDSSGVTYETAYCVQNPSSGPIQVIVVPPRIAPPPTWVQFEYDNYMNWRYTYPEGYYNVLIPLGRWYVHGIGEAPALLIDPMMRQAAIDAYNLSQGISGEAY